MWIEKFFFFLSTFVFIKRSSKGIVTNSLKIQFSPNEVQILKIMINCMMNMWSNSWLHLFQSVKEGGAGTSPENSPIFISKLVWGCLHVLHTSNRRRSQGRLLQLLEFIQGKASVESKIESCQNASPYGSSDSSGFNLESSEHVPNLRFWSSWRLCSNSKQSMTPSPTQNLSISN